MCHKCHVTILALLANAIAAAEASDPEAGKFEKDYDPTTLAPQAIYDLGRLVEVLKPNADGGLDDPYPLSRAILALGADRIGNVAIAAQHIAHMAGALDGMLSQVLIGLAMHGDQRAHQRIIARAIERGEAVLGFAVVESAQDEPVKTDSQIVDELIESMRRFKP
jgi:hypothetical protein